MHGLQQVTSTIELTTNKAPMIKFDVVNSKEYVKEHVTVSGAGQYCFHPRLLIDRSVAFHFPNNTMKKPLSRIMQFQQFI